MRKIAIAGVLLLMLLACGSPSETPTMDKNDTFEKDVTLQDGRTVHCLFWLDRSHSGHSGVSCDWANIRSETD